MNNAAKSGFNPTLSSSFPGANFVDSLIYPIKPESNQTNVNFTQQTPVSNPTSSAAFASNSSTTSTNPQATVTSNSTSYSKLNLNEKRAALNSLLRSPRPLNINSEEILNEGLINKSYSSSNPSKTLDSSAFPKAKLNLTKNLYVKDNLIQKIWQGSVVKLVSGVSQAFIQSAKSFNKIWKFVFELSKNHQKRSKFATYGLFAILTTVIIFGVVALNLQVDLLSKPAPSVAGVVEQKTYDFDLIDYTNWVKPFNHGNFADPDQDLNGDGITNRESYILGIDPSSNHNCAADKTDVENLANFMDPATCKPIDMADSKQADKFAKIFKDSTIHDKLVSNTIQSANPQTVSPAPQTVNTSSSTNSKSLLEVFGVDNLDKINNLKTDAISQTVKLAQTKTDYLKQINRIESYIQKYRDFSAEDRSTPAPLHGSNYLQVSLDYDMPVKYLLAVSRAESRFGTDMYYVSEGNTYQTRPGQYKNPCSLGLDDSGNNLGFATWQDGLAACGKWYKNMKDKGLSTCNMWRIFNPNGDYCGKIEGLAQEIEAYLQQA